MNNKNTAILVLSCDKYADIWQPFFLFFQKYWSDCPFPVYLGTNEKIFSFERVKQIFSHRKTTWSDELQSILHQIPEKNILLILEDYFIYKKVNNAAIFKLLDVMDRRNAAYIKLGAFPIKYNPLWPYKTLADNPELGAIEKGAQYRVCLQTAIWNKETLLNLLNVNENPWQFEIEASKRSNAIEQEFLLVVSDPKQKVVHGPIHYYCTAVTSGKWMRGAIRLCQKENIAIDTTQRKTESVAEEWRRKIYIALPLPVRKAVNYAQSLLKKLHHVGN